MTLQITGIRINHDTSNLTWNIHDIDLILFENIHFHIFEVVYNF